MVLYTPKEFRKENVPGAIELIQANPLGVVISAESALLSREVQIEMTHLPFTVRSVEGDEITLITHMAKANDQVKQLESTGKCKVVFKGTHDSYVSAAWYEQKKIDHKIVSTWDYATVHIEGTVRIIRDDRDAMYNLLSEVTNDHESKRPKDKLAEDIWRVQDAPDKYIDSMIKSIVGVEVKVTKLDFKVKMNQNKPTRDVKKIIESYKSEIGGEKAEYMVQGVVQNHPNREL